MSFLGEVISLCDRTGHMVEDWAEAGYRCWCVDFQHSIRKMKTKGNVNFVWGDARSWIPPFNLRACVFVACFPTCTDMTVAGARDFKIKGLPLLMDGFDLFNYCWQKAAWSGAPYCVENPIGVLSTHHRKPDYIFDPCDFGGYLNPPGDPYTKGTCLWTGNDFIMPEEKRVEPVEGSRMHGLPPGKWRQNLRSITPLGFARAVYLANAPHLRGV